MTIVERQATTLRKPQIVMGWDNCRNPVAGTPRIDGNGVAALWKPERDLRVEPVA